MADLLQELTQYIAAQAGLVIGQDLHAGFFPPEAADLAAVILERGGPRSQPKLRGNVGSYAFQVLARGKTYGTAKQLAQQIDTVLADNAGTDNTGDWQVCVIEAVAAPQFLGYDGKTRPEFSTNYTVRAYEKVAWNVPY